MPSAFGQYVWMLIVAETFRFPDDHARADEIHELSPLAIAVDDGRHLWRLDPDPTGRATYVLAGRYADIMSVPTPGRLRSDARNGD